MDHDLMRAVMAEREPSRAEFEAENFTRNIRALAELELQNEVHGWALRHFDELSPEALRDLYETVGLRRKP